MTAHSILVSLESSGGEFPQWRLTVGRWQSMWTHPSGLASLEALKAEAEADVNVAAVLDRVGEA